jgi:hypothetical protein
MGAYLISLRRERLEVASLVMVEKKWSHHQRGVRKKIKHTRWEIFLRVPGTN